MIHCNQIHPIHRVKSCVHVCVCVWPIDSREIEGGGGGGGGKGLGGKEERERARNNTFRGESMTTSS